MTSTPIAKMVREMIAKGVDPDVIELAVATAEMTSAPVVSGGSPVDIAAEKRRAYDRERKKKLRGIPPESTGIPRNSENPSLSKEVSIDNRKEERETPKRSVRGHRLPVDWRPLPDDQPGALAKLGGSPALEQEILKFHDYWKAQPGQRGVKLDWDATWRNWIRNAKGQPNGRRTVHDAARDLHENLLNRIAAFDEPAPRSVRDGTSPDVVRLLPPRRCE